MRLAVGELPRVGPWVGSDESGKGDYFGPLVVGAVFCGEEVGGRLAELGVQDCKRLSDKRVLGLAPQVRVAVGVGCYRVMCLVPERYNRLYGCFSREGKSLNPLLAWMHMRLLEDLLGEGLRPGYVLVDQFAHVQHVERRVMGRARRLELEVFQVPKAEADIAVAAASILAREAFLGWLMRSSARMGLPLPKGASASVVEAGREVFARGGRDALSRVAKLHFRTTEMVLGQ